MPLMSEEPMQEIYTTKREKHKGHYLLVTRNSKGQFVKVEKWSPFRVKTTMCPRCRHLTLEEFKGEPGPGLKLWVCKRCGFKSIRKANEEKDNDK